MQIAIVLYPGLTALDALGPYEVLRFLPDCDLRFVAHEAGPIIADSGVLVIGATHSFAETPAPDLVLVPGSEAESPSLMADTAFLAWLKRAHVSSRYTLSVCSGALGLAAAGLLDGHPATTHWMAQDALKAFGAIPQPHKRIVQSGKIITSAGVSAGIDLALYVVAELCGRDLAETIQLTIEYDPQPPFDAGHISKARPEVIRLARKEGMRRAVTRQAVVSLAKVAWRRALEVARNRLGFRAYTSASPSAHD